MGVQRGEYTETHTKREAVFVVGRPGIAKAVLHFPCKNKGFDFFGRRLNEGNFFSLEKQMVFSLFSTFKCFFPYNRFFSVFLSGKK